MRLIAPRAVLLGGAHLVAALSLSAYAFGATLSRFDNGSQPATAEPLASTVATILLLPGTVVWTDWASKTLPNSIEWAIFIANSAVWGIALGWLRRGCGDSQVTRGERPIRQGNAPQQFTVPERVPTLPAAD